MRNMRKKTIAIPRRKALFDILKRQFIGLDTTYKTIEGCSKKTIYLDSAATTLMWKPSHKFGYEFLKNYANTHSNIHHSAKISTKVVIWARKRILTLLNADTENYSCVFIGNGSTSCLNRLAEQFNKLRNDRDIVLISRYEHHSNELPHRKFAKVEYIPIDNFGFLDFHSFKKIVKEKSKNIRYVSITAVSNVTGIFNDFNKVAAILEEFEIPLLVDGAQAIAHKKINLSEAKVTAFVFSGHKLYTPGSPGVLVIKTDVLKSFPCGEIGGGVVSDVTQTSFTLSNNAIERQEAGTLNIVGIAMLGATCQLMNSIGVDVIYQHEQDVMKYALVKLSRYNWINIYSYSEYDNYPRIGNFALNLKNIPHGLVAAILNDYFSIAIRNHCFCAHPYVKALLKDDFLNILDDMNDDVDVESQLEPFQGMVRISFGMYSEKSDVDVLINALELINRDVEHYRGQYFYQNNEYINKKQVEINIDDYFKGIVGDKILIE